MSVTAPTVEGTFVTGDTLTASPGTWTGTAPITYTYQWLRCASVFDENCLPIDGATSATYTPRAGDDGELVKVQVTATNAASSAHSFSEAHVIVAPVAPSPVSGATISGVAQDGATLTADPGTWSGDAPISFTYRWLRCDGVTFDNCLPIDGATSATYTAAVSDIGHSLRVVAVGTICRNCSDATGKNSSNAAATSGQQGRAHLLCHTRTGERGELMNKVTKASLAAGAVAISAGAAMATAGAVTNTVGASPGFYCDYTYTNWATLRTSTGNTIDLDVQYPSDRIFVCGGGAGAMLVHSNSCQTGLSQGPDVGIKDWGQPGGPAWGTTATMTKAEQCWRYSSRQAMGSNTAGVGGSWIIHQTYK